MRLRAHGLESHLAGEIFDARARPVSSPSLAEPSGRRGDVSRSAHRSHKYASDCAPSDLDSSFRRVAVSVQPVHWSVQPVHWSVLTCAPRGRFIRLGGGLVSQLLARIATAARPASQQLTNSSPSRSRIHATRVRSPGRALDAGTTSAARRPRRPSVHEPPPAPLRGRHVRVMDVNPASVLQLAIPLFLLPPLPRQFAACKRVRVSSVRPTASLARGPTQHSPWCGLPQTGTHLARRSCRACPRPRSPVVYKWQTARSCRSIALVCASC